MPEIRKPAKLSPLHHSLRSAGAAMTEVSGWLVADNFGDAHDEVSAVRARVGICDQSALPKFELQAKDLAAGQVSFLGIAAPDPGQVAAAEWGFLARLSLGHALVVLSEIESVPPTGFALRQPQAGCLHAVERTHGYGGVLVSGPAAPDVLRKLTSLDIRSEKFRDLCCAIAPMASIRVILVRKDRSGLPSYEIFFSREYGEYLWEVVKQAGEDFAMRPFGSAAEKLVSSSGR